MPAPFVDERLPVAQLAELDQRMAMVDQGAQFGAEQVVIGTLFD